MKITIITLFPNMISGFFNESIVKKAQEKGLVEIELVNLRDFAIDSYGSVDDRPYGGGAGMVMRADVVYAALERCNVKTSKGSKYRTLLTSPRGIRFSQKKAEEYSTLEHIVIIAGHYEGIDERVSDYADEEISLGDFVMTGGEMTAAVITDAVVRLLPGVLKKDTATAEESFSYASIIRIIEAVGENETLTALKKKGVDRVRLLEYPHYTRPEDFMNKKVPEVLLSGNHKEIEKWRIQKAFEETLKRRPDLLQL